MNAAESGCLGENAASEFLREAGYSISERNYKCRFGELDIIACDAEYIAFVEVKTRKSKAFGEAKEFVGAKKQNRVIKAAGYYLAFHSTQLQPRFDVIEVYYDESGKVSDINHLTDAFR